jgi:hypothetical protein
MFTKLRNLFAALFREPDIEILPPLAAGRTKPFPQRPHHQRRQLVRQVLDAAPPSLTDRQLIEFIREQTGIGCSFRTICYWRKQRGGDKEREGWGESKITPPPVSAPPPLLLSPSAALPSPVSPRVPRGAMLCLLLLLTISCRPSQPMATMPPLAAAQSLSNFQSPISNSPSDGIVIRQPSEPSETNVSQETPRLLQLKLTINAPADLLVKTDDEVKAGQALTNRSYERNRLLAQHRVLETQAQQIETQLTTAAESLSLLEQRGADLPPLSFASEQAAITKAEAEAAIIARKVEIQRQRIASFESLVSGDADILPARNSKLETRNLVIEHETAKLTQAQDAERQANAETALQKAKLTNAQESRAFAEKQHALELAKQLLIARQQQQQAILARSQLLTQIAALDLQLSQLAEVRAPFSGKIRRIEWEEQHDQIITVVLYLSVTQ